MDDGDDQNIEQRRRRRRESRSAMRSGDDMPPPPSRQSPSSLQDTETWKASQRGVKRALTNYKDVLVSAFNDMDRDEQESLITRFCMIVTIGVTILVFLLFYNFVPQLVRVFGVPIAVVGAWWAANKVVAPVVIGRMESIMRPAERTDG